jgi:S1-C subfamily serine protease
MLTTARRMAERLGSVGAKVGAVCVAVCLTGFPSPAGAQQPPGGPATGARIVPVPPPPTPFRLGVVGDNTRAGFRVQGVIVGSRATRLGPAQNITLETGDYITRVDGWEVTSSWTLPHAIAASNGVIDVTIWDSRGRQYLTFTGVRLDRK